LYYCEHSGGGPDVTEVYWTYLPSVFDTVGWVILTNKNPSPI